MPGCLQLGDLREFPLPQRDGVRVASRKFWSDIAEQRLCAFGGRVLVAAITVRTVLPVRGGVVAVAARMFSEEQLEQLRSFPDIGRDDLIRYFTLTQADVGFVDPGRGRGPADRLGLAVQLCTLPWLGFVPDEVSSAPPVAVARLAERLGLDPEVLEGYGRRSHTRSDHLLLVAKYLGWKSAVPEADQAQCFGNRPGRTECPGPHPAGLRHGQIRREPALLQHDPDPAPDQGPLPAGVTARHPDSAVGRGCQSLQHLHRRGLPGPVGAQQREELPAAHREGDPSDRIKAPPARAAVAPLQVPDRDNAVVVPASFPPDQRDRRCPPSPVPVTSAQAAHGKPHRPSGRRTRPLFPAGPRITTAKTLALLAAASSASIRSSRNAAISGYGWAGRTTAGRR